MGRFQVSVTKVSGNEHSLRSFLHVDVKSFTENTTDDDPNRNLTSVSIFNILEPQAQSIRIEAVSDFSSILQSNMEIQKESSSDTADAAVEDPKIVQILHKRMFLGLSGALLVDEALNEIRQKLPVSDIPCLSPIEFNKDGGKSVKLNVREFKFNEKVTIVVDAVDRKNDNLSDELQSQDANNNMESEEAESAERCPESSSFIMKRRLDDEAKQLDAGAERSTEIIDQVLAAEDATIKQNAENNSGVEGIAENKSTEKTSETDNTTGTMPKTELKEDTKIDAEEVNSPDVTPKSSSPNLVFVIANALLITVEVDRTPLIIEGEVEIPMDQNWSTDVILEASDESFLEPGTILDFPWRKKEDPTAVVTTKKIKQKETRKELFRKLIQERLLAFGLPHKEAFTITDAWHTGYVQQRAWSYRVPKCRPRWNPPIGLNPSTDVQVKAETFAYNLLRNAEILQGTLDGATCTVIEATFFLMIPHAKMPAAGHKHRNSNHLESFTSSTFVTDWIQVIFAAAHQLKPSDPNSVTGIVDKETKLLRKLLKNVRKASLKIKRKFKHVQQNVETLRKKMFSRVEPNPEWKGDNSDRNEETAEVNTKIPGSIQVPDGLTAENLFENYVHVAVGRTGLVLRRHLTDPWCHVVNLNFLERRVLFLGLTDHMFSTFDTILSTLRHLQELYTPGYPLNILARLANMFELLRDRSRPYEYLAAQTRSLLYSKIYALSQGFDRFCYTFSQLSKICKEANYILSNISYNPVGSEDFLKKVGLERMHIHLVVPFTTLSLKGLNEVKLRSRGLPHEKPTASGTET